MSSKQRAKIITDLCMALALPLLMAQALIGEEVHECIGAAMLILVVVHSILNVNWYRSLFKGKYTPFRVFQLIIDLPIALFMIGLMVSGIMMSRHVFAFLPIGGGSAFARTLHMVSAYWGFILMSLHVGLHTNMMMAAMRKAAGVAKPSTVRKVVLRIMAAFLCAYGAYAFGQRQIGSYMLLRSMFVFFDYSEPLAFFFVDYIAIMGMSACVGHYISAALRKIPAKRAAKMKNRE